MVDESDGTIVDAVVPAFRGWDDRVIDQFQSTVVTALFTVTLINAINFVMVLTVWLPGLRHDLWVCDFGVCSDDSS